MTKVKASLVMDGALCGIEHTQEESFHVRVVLALPRPASHLDLQSSLPLNYTTPKWTSAFHKEDTILMKTLITIEC